MARGKGSGRGRSRGGRGRSVGGKSVRVDWIRHLTIDMRAALKLLARLAMEDIETDARNKNQTGTGRRMPDLSPEYAAKKKKELGHSEPDLTMTGAMWRSFQLFGIDKESVTIGFPTTTGDDVKKYRALKKQKRNPLGLSKADIKRFAKEMIRRGMLKKEHGPPPRKSKP